MVRTRPLVNRAAVTTLIATLLGTWTVAQEPAPPSQKPVPVAEAPAKSVPTPKPAPTPTKDATKSEPAKGKTAEPKPVPIDQQPYKIRVSLSFDESTRVDQSQRSLILADWLRLVERFVGRPWKLELISPDPVLNSTPIDDLKPNAFTTTVTSGCDKVWAIQVLPRGAGFEAVGREFDRATGYLGNTHREPILFPTDTARGLFKLTLAMFAPSAEIGPSKAGGVVLTVKGASLPASSPIGQVVTIGTIFRALRLFTDKKGAVTEIAPIRYSYFRVDKLDGPTADCAIVSGLRDPLTKRVARPNRLVALGIKPAGFPTRLRFVLASDKQPAAGYTLTARSLPQGSPREVGMTDRDGRIVLPPGFASGLVVLRLIAGRVEPMAEMPLMPGETPEELTIPFEPRPHTLNLEAQLDALRDQIVDLVAVRGRLDKRMQARVDGEDWNGLAEALAEYNKLPPRSKFEKTLETLRSDAQNKESQLKTLVLTKTARAQLDEIKALIDRYLDDDLFNAYADALEQSKNQAILAAQAKTKKGAAGKAAPAVTKAGPTATPAKTQTPTPAPVVQAPVAQPKAAPAPAPAAKKGPDGAVPF